jgi:hypothetical protein
MPANVSKVSHIGSTSTNRRSVDLLPDIFRTDKNAKFLAGTLDQYIQPAQIERINAWFGSKNTPTYNPATDNYIGATSQLREAYQVEPSLVVTDANLNTKEVLAYDDLINKLNVQGASTTRLDTLFNPEFYSYDPNIDWDKLINFEKYYWMPYGPDVISVTGQIKATVSTYSVTDTPDGNYFLFTPDGLTPSPQLTLFRGVTYIFNINTSKPFWFKTQRVAGTESPYRVLDTNGIKNGQIIFTVDENTPKILYYVAQDNEQNGGEIIIESIEDNSNIDVVNDVLGKQTYTSGNNIQLSNGMRIMFEGNVTPVEYQNKEFYVEGVGDAIRLVDVSTLSVPEKFISTLDENFDATPFDDYPFDTFINAPLTPEYVTINRSSLDRNPWSRYNRWFHEDVIIASATYNNRTPVLPVENRAKRPIVEFTPDLQLFNFGSVAVDNVQHIDTTTTDVFNAIEGQLGFYVDGVEIANGDRIIFTADRDNYVTSRIWQVTFAQINGTLKIALVEATDSPPWTGANVIITQGTTYKGTNWWFNGTNWVYGQQKSVLNQAPRFDVFDSDQNSLFDTTSNFQGTKVFGYGIGTGVTDTILGFPLKYQNIADQAFYLFENYFMQDQTTVVSGNTTTYIPIYKNFLKKNTTTGYTFLNVWKEAETYTIPVLQSVVPTTDTTSIEVTGVNYPAYNNITLQVFVNNVKYFEGIDYTRYPDKSRLYVNFTNTITANDYVLFKIYGDAVPNENGYYEVSPTWANNPLNGVIQEFTLSELTDHLKSMADRHPNFSGSYLGKNNSRDLPNLSSYGTRLIRNKNPLAFAGYFVTDNDHNIIDAVQTVERHYNQFKLNFISQATALKGIYDPVQAVDIIMHNINVVKDRKSQYYYTDMIAYGTDVTTHNVTVTDPRNTQYGLDSIFIPSTNNPRTIYVYHTPIDTGMKYQLVIDNDYEFDQYESTVTIKRPLTKGDIITVSDYPSTDGSFIPPTPTKLGLYPKYIPDIYYDNSYSGDPQLVIKGHDGSIMLAFNDYRDNIILELERRIYNNIKVNYNPDLLNIHGIIPGRFRSTKIGKSTVNSILTGNFLRWNNFYGFDFERNDTYSDSPRTWNFRSANDPATLIPLVGNHRGIYSYYFDTTTPHMTPWEMLGFSIMPDWWISTYGPAPYTSGNEVLWTDLENGYVRDPANPRVNPLFVRTGLSQIIPVDASGNLLDPASSGIAQNVDVNKLGDDWEFGDQGPVETAWRRSSHYTYAVQLLMILADPSSYASLLFDTSRMQKSLAGQYIYTESGDFLKPSDLVIYGDETSTPVRAAGYSPMLVETGKVKNKTYIQDLKTDLSNVNMKLLTKVGGFVSQDKLEIIIDSVNPATTNPGVALSNEDYEIFLDQGHSVESLGISGMIIQKTLDGYAIRGYDNIEPYFTCFTPILGLAGVSVGAKSESYVNWTASSPTGTGLTSADLSNAVSANTGYIFYKAGQVVLYNGKYYRAKIGHTSGTTFNLNNFTPLPGLPTVGGVSVVKAARFDTTEIKIPYGKILPTIQDVYNVIVGYGAWLESKGAIFDEFVADLSEVINWDFTAKEFLYWASQGWSNNSVITLSPFANQIQYQNDYAMVDDLGSSYYEYSVIKADGKPLKEIYLNVMRQDGVITVRTRNTNDGIYFIRFNCVQKEHVLIFNNRSLFNDVIYDVESGYSQRRLKLNGLRTSNWNGSLYSPGFIYDEAIINDWAEYTDYRPGDIVRYSGNYYSAVAAIDGTSTFDYTLWQSLDEKPVSRLLPNFDYKIGQFQDFYSLDIDNFDSNQQALAQHLIGYTPRPYLDNVFINPISQYKFYQGFIREKGTKNTISKLAKASKQTLGSYIDYFEEWAFRIGEFGSYTTDNSLEINLDENTFKENSQVISFVDTIPAQPKQPRIYKTPNDLIISPTNYSSTPFATTSTKYQDVFELPYAGYVRLDDVTATAFNKSSLTDVANNRGINDGDTVWLGFTESLDWEVYRHTMLSAKANDASILVQGSTLLITTDLSHGLSKNDLVNITQFDPQINGVYQVLEVMSNDQFVIKTTLTTLPTKFNPGLGVMFKFVSVRFREGPDQLADFSMLSQLTNGENVWIDNDGTGIWTVLQKQQAYTGVDYNPMSGGSVRNQEFSADIAVDPTGNKIIVGAPNFYNGTPNNYNLRPGVYGKVYALKRENTSTVGLVKLSEITLNIDATHQFNDSTVDPRFGSAVVFDSDNNIVIAGAPNASGVKFVSNSHAFYDVTTSASTSTTRNKGMIKLTTVNYDGKFTATQHFAFTSYENIQDAYFGSDLYLGNISKTNKLLAVSAPGNTGSVYWSTYTIGINSGTVSITTGTSSQKKLSPTLLPSVAGDKFGTSITGDDTATIMAVGAPGLYGGYGGVYIFTYSTTENQFVNSDLISYNDSDIGLMDANVGFGEKVLIDKTGYYLFIGASRVSTNDYKTGQVYVYTRNGNTFNYFQTLECPFEGSINNFGFEFAINPNSNSLYISSLKEHVTPDITFDTYSISLGNYINDQTSPPNLTATTFDGKSTTFQSKSKLGTGSVYTFERLDSKFYYGQELKKVNPADNQGFANALAATNNTVFVGAPGTNVPSEVGILHLFDHSQPTWKRLRVEDNLVDLDKIRTITTIDTDKQDVLDYIEIFDPLKGRIPGYADQEIKYKTAFDPAVYSIGVPGVNVDSGTNWIDEHVGELWWDLSSVKYIWYEQGNLDFRKNSWGNLFPGCTIDIYEWVSSTNLPSQWSAIADTNAGLSQGISGQPKFPSNAVISIKQVYNPTTNALTNIYYYWVKNKITIPAIGGRSMSALDVAQLIANPKAQGMKYISMLSSSALALTNLKTDLIGTNINLNIDMDLINNQINKHTEWLLLQEGNAESLPNTLLAKKVKDSLLGRDSLGNPVPDSSLTERTRYGVGVRPRQTLFKNRFDALRVYTEYVNSILVNLNIVNYINLDYFTSSEAYATPSQAEYDVVVESALARDVTVVTRNLLPTSLSVSLLYGRVTGVSIINAGYGYGTLYPVEYDTNNLPIVWTGPTVEVVGNGTSAEIATFINSAGQVIKTEIKNPGKNYTSVPTAVVRPFTVLVQADETVNNRWSYYAWDYSTKTYLRTRTQSWNTPEYWHYVDWKDPTYNRTRDISRTINSTYQLSYVEDLLPGSYVKINNLGDGRYVILRKTNGTVGTFNNSFDLIYQQNGTIQIDDMIWDNQFGFDYVVGFDQLTFDQKPDVETENIINGVNEIFKNDYQVYANKLFFKLVKFALTEQKFIDWAFKTSFISVVNNAGALDQRPTYSLNNETYYEDYINETKPYHTKIRNFQANYTATDFTQSVLTDFDTPAVYNTLTQKFVPVQLGNPLTLQSPWKEWYNNYKYHVDSVEIYDGGSGYIYAPQVVFSPAPGDSGSGAAGEAYISQGKVTQVVITNPGSGYTLTPIMNLLGGGPSDLTPARFGIRMSNGLVRSQTITMKFDRVSGYNEIPSAASEDTFRADGYTDTYRLTWTPMAEKSLTTVTVNGIKQLADAYSITVSTEKFNGYTKSYGEIKLASPPAYTATVIVNYIKDVGLYHAVDRIRDYYSPTSGMPGNTATLLMAGLEYPGVTIDTIPLLSSTGFDSTPFGSNNWDDYLPEVGLYSTTGSHSSSVFTLNYVPQIGNTLTVYVNNVRIYGTGTVSSSTHLQLINGLIQPDGYTNTVDIYTTTTEIVSFRLASSDGSLPIIDPDLDTYISGGNSFTTISQPGVADNPSPLLDDIAIDGDSLISRYNSYGPEENLPGRVSESLGISVYTQPAVGSALTVLRSYVANSNTNVYSIGTTPPNADSVEVLLNNTILSNYTIDYAKQHIVLPQPVVGILSIKTISVGGTNLLEQKTIVATTATTIVDMAPQLTTVQDWYITLNGQKLVKDTDFRLTAYNLRTRITLTTPLQVNDVLQIWLFAAPMKAFSEVRAQTITAQPNTTSWVLTYPPEDIQPYHTQVIVEQDGKRLAPPPTVYYVADGQTTSYSLNKNIPWGTAVPSRKTVQVYVNGIPKQYGNDFELVQNENRINFLPNIVKTGDVIAICVLLSHQYTVSDGNLYVTGLVNTNTTSTIKVYSFTNDDASFIRRETFTGANGTAFVLSRDVLGIEYLWVDLNGMPLMRGFDFDLIAPNQIKLNERTTISPSDSIVVTSVSNIVENNVTLGYRVFLDNLGRVSYKRLSKVNSTQLASTLTSTATTIDVVNASVLTQPNAPRLLPGVILINGERIQFYKVEGNTLSQLVRGSLGTGIRDSYSAGTTVLDQGSDQTLNVEDRQISWITVITGTSALSYDISNMSVLNATTNTTYDVYYQGRLLRRPSDSVTATDISLAYDSNEITAEGTASNYNLLGEYSIIIANTGTTLVLNTASVTPGARLQVISRYGQSMYAQIQPGTTHNIPVDPMHSNVTPQVEFLSRSPSALPDKYYYGQQ